MRYLDHIAADLCDVSEHFRKAARTVRHEKFEDDVAAVANETLLNDQRQQIGIDVPPGENSANRVRFRKPDLACQQSCDARCSCTLDDDMIVLDAMKYASDYLF